MDEMRENKVGDFKEKIITKSNEPLIPKIDANSNYNQNIRKSIEENLLDRLSVAILKQKQCENAISAPWSPLDNSDFQENLIIDDSLKSVKLPKHVEENIKGISQSAKEYINKLEEQLEELDIADNQVKFFIMLRLICFFNSKHLICLIYFYWCSSFYLF